VAERRDGSPDKRHSPQPDIGAPDVGACSGANMSIMRGPETLGTVCGQVGVFQDGGAL
jgi:hypothetical protein